MAEQDESTGGTRNEASGAADNVVQARDVQGGIHVHHTKASTWPTPRQLPPDITYFTDRAAELAKLDALLDAAIDGDTAPVVISAIGGAGGMGKTSLAVRWAHKMRDRFPDGELCVNLRGYDAGQPVTPEQALDGFLRAMDVPGERIPQELDDRAALYRSLVAGRRMLIVLDNAADAEQVRPLLPGSATCLTLVTSRRRLSGLMARDGGARIALDVLPPDEAVRLLRQVIGSDRVDAEPEAAAELARRCAYVPLALRIVGDRLADRPQWSIADVVEDLAEESERLDVLATEDDENTQIRTVFSWSYRALSPETARAFRLLGLNPGPDISLPAAAALLGTTTATARRQLDALTNVHLLDEPIRARYQFHDLMRTYAAERAAQDEDDDERTSATERLLEWYLHTAHAALRTFHPAHPEIPIDPPSASFHLPNFKDLDHALAWCEAEHVSLLAAVRLAFKSANYGIAWKMPMVMTAYLNMRNSYIDHIEMSEIGLAAARRMGDSQGQLRLLLNLGWAYWAVCRFQQAESSLSEALSIARQDSDRWGEGAALTDLGICHVKSGRYELAIGYLQRGLAIFEEIDKPVNQGVCLTFLSEALRGELRLDEAVEAARQGLVIHRSLGNRWGEAFALTSLGQAQSGLLLFDDAEISLREALAIFHEIEDKENAAKTLLALGDATCQLGRSDAARRSWNEALALFDELGSPDAEEVRKRLNVLDSGDS
jgi:tetratricopeptide (TPR) repeat protein